MLFQTFPFFIFFLCFTTLFFLLPLKNRMGWIIVGSTFFYGYWNPYFIWLPHALILIAYWGAQWMNRSNQSSIRRRRLILILIALFIPLITFKYANFFYSTVSTQAKLWDLQLPLGISFITFTLIAYVIDIYNGRLVMAQDWKSVASAILFFPHLIAGPIVRVQLLIPQFEKKLPLRFKKILLGLTLFSWGMFKKVILADSISPIVNEAYLFHPNLPAWKYWFAFYGFAFQIYCDFSGYTDMAMGTARMLGVRLPINFRMPYIALNIKDFWSRWHITLSLWLRDYLYIPLGGNRNGTSRQISNILITMLLGGLWHGANWTFVIWGAFHGIGIVFSHLWDRIRFFSVPKWLSLLLTFHFVTAAWVIFRAPSIETAVMFFKNLIAVNLFIVDSTLIFPCLALGVAAAIHPIDSVEQIFRFYRRTPTALLWPILMALWLLSLIFGASRNEEFIYFDF